MSSPVAPFAVLFGTRPEAIKLAPVIAELRSRGRPTAVIATGQHRDLVGSVLDLFGIVPDHDLALMRRHQSLDHILSRVVPKVGSILDEIEPSALLVQGDTTSAMGGAVAAFHHRVPVAHVEAGLRSGNLDLPFPEELNRRVIGLIAKWHFAPTDGAAANLRQEGTTGNVIVTGNTVVDALQHIQRHATDAAGELGRFASEGPFILATAHRRESWEGGIERIATALREILRILPDHRLIFATHPNPIARAPVEELLAATEQARVVTALSYPTFLQLLAMARVAITDSGGVQEEAPTLGVPTLVTREVTERPEGVAAGAVMLVGTDVHRIVEAATDVLSNRDRHHRMAIAGRRLYGDGTAARQIVDRLVIDLPVPA